MTTPSLINVPKLRTVKVLDVCMEHNKLNATVEGIKVMKTGDLLATIQDGEYFVGYAPYTESNKTAPSPYIVAQWVRVKPKNISTHHSLEAAVTAVRDLLCPR